jgi:hypothetical protein
MGFRSNLLLYKDRCRQYLNFRIFIFKGISFLAIYSASLIYYRGAHFLACSKKDEGGFHYLLIKAPAPTLRETKNPEGLNSGAVAILDPPRVHCASLLKVYPADIPTNSPRDPPSLSRTTGK